MRERIIWLSNTARRKAGHNEVFTGRRPAGRHARRLGVAAEARRAFGEVTG